MKTPLPLVLLSAAAPFAFGIGDCSGPGSFCETLRPGMVAFIGTRVSVVRDPNRTPIVTFRIRERLVGLANAESAAVVFADGYSDSNEPQLLIVTPEDGGRYLHDDCGAGILLRLNDGWAKEFQTNVATRAPAKVSVIVQSWPGVVPIPGVHVQLHGNGRIYEGNSRSHAALDLGTVPPGEYEVTATRPHFTLPHGPHRLTILPGSCAPLRILMRSVSTISGRVVDARGEPVVHSRFHIYGAGRALSSSSMYDWVVGRMVGMLFKRTGHVVIETAETGSDGSFQFTGVYPGWYRLVTDPSEINPREGLPLPKTYYPGVSDWPQATALSVEEGQSVKNVLFRLPDFGMKRLVEIQVVDEDGIPVRGAVVSDTGIDCAKIGTQKISGKDGRVTLALWLNAEYSLSAALWMPQSRLYSAGPFSIPAGTSPVSQVVVLKGYHSRKPAR